MWLDVGAQVHDCLLSAHGKFNCRLAVPSWFQCLVGWQVFSPKARMKQGGRDLEGRAGNTTKPAEIQLSFSLAARQTMVLFRVSESITTSCE